MPVAAIDMVTAQLGAEISVGDASGPRLRPRLSGGTVAAYAVRLEAGMRKAVPLGSFGEFGLDAGLKWASGQEHAARCDDAPHPRDIRQPAQWWRSMGLMWFHAFRGRTIPQVFTVLKEGPEPNPLPTCTTKVNEGVLGIESPHVYAYLGRTYEPCLDACVILSLSGPVGLVSPFDTGGLVTHTGPVSTWDVAEKREFLLAYTWPSTAIHELIEDYPTLGEPAVRGYVMGDPPLQSGPHEVWTGRTAAEIWHPENDWPSWTWELRCPGRLPTGDLVARWTGAPGMYPLLVQYIENNPNEADSLIALLATYFEGGASHLHAAYVRGDVQ